MTTPKKRAAIPKGGNDCIMTPDSLALAIVEHFKPEGYAIMDPCEGDGAFTRAFHQRGFKLVFSGDITNGPEEDFLTWEAPVDWVITNPPWSKFRVFLIHAMEVAENIVFVGFISQWFVKSRINAMKAAGFHFREFANVANPKKPWPQMGLQLAAVHISRTPGNCVFTEIDWKP